MTTSPLTVLPETSVGEASDILEEHDLRHLPVVDLQGKLVGMVSDRDIRSAFPSTIVDSDDLMEKLEEVQKIPVSEIMSKKPMVLRTTSTLEDAMLFFEKRMIGALPVLNEMNKVVGVLSFQDLMKAWQGIFGLGEKGSFLMPLVVTSSDQSILPLLQALEELNIPVNSVIRTEGKGREPAMVYIKVKTYNIISVHSAIEQAGFKVYAPDE